MFEQSVCFCVHVEKVGRKTNKTKKDPEEKYHDRLFHGGILISTSFLSATLGISSLASHSLSYGDPTKACKAKCYKTGSECIAGM